VADEAIIEDAEINLDEPQIIGSEDGEVHEREEPDDGFRTTIIVDDGISTPENPGMMIRTRARHLFLIDAEDLPKISEFKWSVSSDGDGRMCVSTRIGKKKIYLHRMLLDAPDGQRVDHRNGDPLDNRKANLRLATYQQNMFNRRKAKTYGNKPTTSSFKGVSWDNSCGRYKAQIMKDRVNHNLGRFRDQRSAAMAYARAAQEMFGEFAYTNLIYQDREEDARPSLGEDHRSDLPYSLAS
jgi:HNH endonuclease/AP2 domain